MVVVALVAIGAGGLHRLSAAALHRARADTVADLVALAAVERAEQGAAVQGAVPDARRVARANGAELLELRVRGDVVTITVALVGHRSSASAAPRGAPLGDEQSSGRDRQ